MTTPDQITIIHASDVQAGLQYPYLPPEWEWELRMIPYACWEAERDWQAVCGITPTLRLVRDNGLVDLYVPDMDTATFLAHWGLTTSMVKGGYVLCKRLSRLLHPYRWWGFFAPEDIKVVHSPVLDASLWDGAGRMSERFVRDQLLPRLATLPTAVRDRYERELLHTKRFEITLMHPGGQEKGDVIVVDERFLPPGADFLFPQGSAKQEVRQQGQVFVGLAQARHAKVGMRLDMQSLVNLHPFLTPDQLLTWLQAESDLFLEGLTSGHATTLYSRLAGDEAQLERLQDWSVGEFLVSGGDVRHFPTMTREVARQHLHRLQSVQDKLRLPAPGGRFYILPAGVGGREVAPGEVELDLVYATAWVSNHDWRTYLVGVLGGCDGDDGVWVLPFTDLADGGRKVLVWRSPNQMGEYVLLRPTPASAELRWATVGGEAISWPELDSRHLPPRIDTILYQYATLAELDSGLQADASYSVAAMAPTIDLAIRNRGTLGQYCNALLVLKSIYGRLPHTLPSTLETIIDGSVKKFINLEPVKDWCRRVALWIVNQGDPVPETVLHRLVGLLPTKRQQDVILSTGHWLDDLLAAVADHRAAYLEQVETLAAQAVPPAELFQHLDPNWLDAGRALRRQYADVLRAGGMVTEARAQSESLLLRYPAEAHGMILLNAAAQGYAQQAEGEGGDSVVWQRGPRRADGSRAPGLAQQFLQVLRSIGYLGEPIWTAEGTVVYYPPVAPVSRPVAVRLTGVWYNTLCAEDPTTPACMSAVPKTVRDVMKQRVAQRAQRQYVGLELHFCHIGARLVAHTADGVPFAYVPPTSESHLADAQQWRIAWATATDGNLNAILSPVSS